MEHRGRERGREREACGKQSDIEREGEREACERQREREGERGRLVKGTGTERGREGGFRVMVHHRDREDLMLGRTGGRVAM